VGPRAGLDDLQKNVSCTCRDKNPGPFHPTTRSRPNTHLTVYVHIRRRTSNLTKTPCSPPSRRRSQRRGSNVSSLKTDAVRCSERFVELSPCRPTFDPLARLCINKCRMTKRIFTKFRIQLPLNVYTRFSLVTSVTLHKTYNSVSDRGLDI
jgi:hypothetical protein